MAAIIKTTLAALAAIIKTIFLFGLYRESPFRYPSLRSPRSPTRFPNAPLHQCSGNTGKWTRDNQSLIAESTDHS